MITDLLFFVNFWLFAFASVFFCAVKWNIRPEKSFFPMLLLNSLIYYIFASFHCSGYGFTAIYTANMLLYIPIFFIGTKLGRDEFKTRVFTPGVFVLSFWLLATFIVSWSMPLVTWDAYSHWGAIIKLFIAEQKMWCEYPYEVLRHASYPPGAGMSVMLIHSCFVGRAYSEGIVNFAYNVLNYGPLIWLFLFVSWKERKKMIILLFLMLFTLPLLYCTDVYAICYTDSILALLMGITFFHLVSLKDHRPFDLFILALMTSWLFMIRNTGWGYALGIMLIFTIQLWFDRKKAFYTENGKISPLKIFWSAMVYLLPVILKYSWLYQLKYYETTLRFGGNNITAAGFKEQFGSIHGAGWQLLGLFLLELLKGYIIFMIVLVIFAVMMYRRCDDPLKKRAIKTTMIFFILGFCGFITTMFIYYVFEFKNEMSNFPSMARYMNSFLLIPGFVLVLIALDAGTLWGKKIDETSQNWKKYKFFGYQLLLIVFFVSLMRLPLGFQREMRKFIKECDRIRQYDTLISVPGVKFAHFCLTGNTFKTRYFNYAYPHNFREIPCWDPVHPESAEPARFYSQKITPEDIRKIYFPKVDYIYIDDQNQAFCRDYSSLFEPGFTVNSDNICGKLFIVTENNLLKPADR